MESLNRSIETPAQCEKRITPLVKKMLGYLIYGDICIAVDLFSRKKGAMRPGEVRVLDVNKPLKQQLYEALSGSKWDEVIDKIDHEWKIGD